MHGRCLNSTAGSSCCCKLSEKAAAILGLSVNQSGLCLDFFNLFWVTRPACQWPPAALAEIEERWGSCMCWLGQKKFPCGTIQMAACIVCVCVCARYPQVHHFTSGIIRRCKLYSILLPTHILNTPWLRTQHVDDMYRPPLSSSPLHCSSILRPGEVRKLAGTDRKAL